ncbi:MAG: DUF3726 domain-containing protein [Woeseiaceae bacterium]|nr:DUF3726 domain-containing protein [Woeseiaceae bacterium]
MLKRAFEALGYNQGDYEDAARAVVWLESRAMHGLELALRDWQRLSKAGSALEILPADNGVQVLAAHDSSILTCGHCVADLAAAALEQHGSGRIVLRQCYSRMAILPSLELCARRGAAAAACWNDSNYQHVARIDAWRTNPEYRRMKITPDNTASAATLHFACHTQPQEVAAFLAEISSDGAQSTPDYLVLPEEMAAHRQAAIRQGIAVSDELVAELTTTAEAVLVAASEQSRRGAGEA